MQPCVVGNSGAMLSPENIEHFPAPKWQTSCWVVTQNRLKVVRSKILLERDPENTWCKAELELYQFSCLGSERHESESSQRKDYSWLAWPSPTCTWCVCGELQTPGCPESYLHRHHIPCLVCSPALTLSPWECDPKHLFTSPTGWGGGKSCPPVPNISSKLGRARLLEQNAGGRSKPVLLVLSTLPHLPPMFYFTNGVFVV